MKKLLIPLLLLFFSLAGAQTIGGGGGGGGGGGFANPMTTLGDTIFENSTPAAARLAGPTAPNSVAQIPVSIPSGGVAQAPAWALPGVAGRTITSVAGCPVVATDRNTWVVFNSASAFTCGLGQAGTGGGTNSDLTSNFSFCYVNQGAGTITLSPTTSTVDGAATIPIPSFQSGCVPSIDNTNYLTRRSGPWVAFNNTGQTANVAAATNQYTVPTAQGGFYRVSCYNVVTTAATTSSTMPSCQVVWTDDDANVAIAAVTFTPTSTGNTVGTTNSVACPATCTNATNNNQNGGIVVNAKAGTNIQVPTTGYASTGATAMQYANHVKIEYLGRSSN